MNGGIKRETFEEMDTDSKLNVLFDYITEVRENLKWQKATCLTAASISGFIGGIVAHLGEKIGFWK